MKELLAFLLPPAVAFLGLRISRLALGKKIEDDFAFGLRFALGLAVGTVVLSQTILLTALAGINLSGALAWLAIIWGVTEVALLVPTITAKAMEIKFQPGHLWLLLLLPVIYAAWVFGKLSTLEGTLEFDANAFWVFKSKILYLEQGKNLLDTIHQSNLSYAHMDYPMLVPCLYTLGYGLVGGVDEFINKVWPFWMIVALSAAIFSLARFWRRPGPLPVLIVTLLWFLPATMSYIRNEGGTIPMVFCVSMAAILFVRAISEVNMVALSAGILVLVACATTKFEGVIYTALWGSAALVFCWKHGSLQNRMIWKVITMAAICLVPYFCLKLVKPVSHPESDWVHQGMTSPGTVLHRFPQTLFLNVGNRFFSKRYFNWETADKDHLQFAGKWEGLKSFINPELFVLPWLLLILIALSFWKKPKDRTALGMLVAITVTELVILSFAISCLDTMQSDLSKVIDFASNVVGRYYYPFFMSCLLGAAALWIKRDAAAPLTVERPVKVKKASPRQKGGSNQ